MVRYRCCSSRLKTLLCFRKDFFFFFVVALQRAHAPFFFLCLMLARLLFCFSVDTAVEGGGGRRCGGRLRIAAVRDFVVLICARAGGGGGSEAAQASGVRGCEAKCIQRQSGPVGVSPMQGGRQPVIHVGGGPSRWRKGKKRRRRHGDGSWSSGSVVSDTAGYGRMRRRER